MYAVVDCLQLPTLLTCGVTTWKHFEEGPLDFSNQVLRQQGPSVFLECKPGGSSRDNGTTNRS